MKIEIFINGEKFEPPSKQKQNLTGEQIASQIEKAIKEKGISKLRIGEALGALPRQANQSKYYKVNSFFRKLKRNEIDIPKVESITQLLGIDQNLILKPK